jgi:hypothetical protein
VMAVILFATLCFSFVAKLIGSCCLVAEVIKDDLWPNLHKYFSNVICLADPLCLCLLWFY